MTTPIRISPWATVAKFGSSFRNVMSVRISCRMTTPTRGPKTSAPTAGQADTTEHDRGDAQEGVRPGNRRAPPGARREGQATERGEQPAEHVREDLGPADRHAAAERGKRVAADGVQGQAEPRA